MRGKLSSHCFANLVCLQRLLSCAGEENNAKEQNTLRTQSGTRALEHGLVMFDLQSVPEGPQQCMTSFQCEDYSEGSLADYLVFPANSLHSLHSFLRAVATRCHLVGKRCLARYSLPKVTTDLPGRRFVWVLSGFIIIINGCCGGGVLIFRSI